MSSSQKGVVDCISAGETPKEKLRNYETIKFVVYNFIDRKETQDEHITSPIGKAHGYEWTIKLYPNFGDKVYATLDLHGKNNAVTATCVFRCKGFVSKKTEQHSFTGRWDLMNEQCRSVVIEECLEEDGSLVIEFDIRIAPQHECVWYPKELQQQDILVELYQDASSETADAVFSVGEITFRVHKNILFLRSKKLYEIAKDFDNDDDEPIPIESVSAEIFKSILDFLYSVKTPQITSEGMATKFLVAADRYDCIHLKLYVESVIVDKFLKAENAAALLIFADSYSCALLKEAATNVFVAVPLIVKNTEAWSKIEESHRLVTELLNALVYSKKLATVDGAIASGIDQWNVTTLREKLGEANLQLDGSRGILIDRLNTHRQQSHEDQDDDSDDG